MGPHGSIFLYRHYVCRTVVSARVYPRCHSFRLIMDSVHPLSLHYIFFFFILSVVRLSSLGTAANTGLLYQPQMIDDGDCGAIDEVLGENLPQRHFVQYKSHMSRPGLEPGPPR
jgi:hypothetical protein